MELRNLKAQEKKIASELEEQEAEEKLNKAAVTREKGRRQTKFLYSQRNQLSVVTEESFEELDVDIFKPIEDADRLERQMIAEGKQRTKPKQLSIVDKMILQIQDVDVIDLFNEENKDGLDGAIKNNEELIKSLTTVSKGVKN